MGHVKLNNESFEYVGGRTILRGTKAAMQAQFESLQNEGYRVTSSVDAGTSIRMEKRVPGRTFKYELNVVTIDEKIADLESEGFEADTEPMNERLLRFGFTQDEIDAVAGI